MNRKLIDELKGLLEESLMTSEDDGHRHEAMVDENGDGKTSPGPKDGHVHEIKDWEVLEANGHIHTLPKKEGLGERNISMGDIDEPTENEKHLFDLGDVLNELETTINELQLAGTDAFGRSNIQGAVEVVGELHTHFNKLMKQAKLDDKNGRKVKDPARAIKNGKSVLRGAIQAIDEAIRLLQQSRQRLKDF